MKIYRLLLLAATLVGSAAALSAGPGPQFWIRPAAPKAKVATAPAASARPAAPATLAVTSCATCACCKKTS
jgi:hypothetical protein